jgi:DNA-directed RNA polymerase subunit RPC12/RpoP
VHLLGGEERLWRAREQWDEFKAVEATGKISLCVEDIRSPITDSEDPGGSSEKSCAICWKPFGSLVNRKHRCRATRRHVCDECSSKRVVQDGKDHRVCDGQFALARVDSAEAERRRAEENLEEVRIRGLQAQKTLAQIRLERLEAEEKADRDSLFGGMLGQAATYVFGADDEEADMRPAAQVEGLAASLGETRNALLERGEKLSSLDEKSAKMVDASADFAKMAKELRRKSEAGLFW